MRLRLRHGYGYGRFSASMHGYGYGQVSASVHGYGMVVQEFARAWARSIFWGGSGRGGWTVGWGVISFDHA